jgi:hypothetical protein
MRTYLPETAVTFFPTTYWMLVVDGKTWCSKPNIDICPRCYEIYKQEIQNTERRFMQPDLRDVD